MTRETRHCDVFTQSEGLRWLHSTHSGFPVLKPKPIIFLLFLKTSVLMERKHFGTPIAIHKASHEAYPYKTNYLYGASL